MNMNMNKLSKIKISEYPINETKQMFKSTSNLKYLSNNNLNGKQNYFDAKSIFCKKHSSSNNSNHFIENRCGRECENLKHLQEMEIKMKELIESNEKLKMINEFLVNSIRSKEDMYLAISKELQKTKNKLGELKNKERSLSLLKNYSFGLSSVNESHLHKFKIKLNKIGNRNRNIDETGVENKKLNRSPANNETTEMSDGFNLKIPKIKIALTKETDLNVTKLANERGNFIPKHKTMIINNDSITPNAYRPNSNLITFMNSSHLKEILSNKVNTHYQKIRDLGRNLSRKYQNQSRRSLLSMNDDEFKKLINFNLQNEIYDLTFSDEEFISTMRNASDEKLISYCDIIGGIIKDFKHAIKLIQRIKHFLKNSVNFVKSVLLQDTTTCLIRNTCEILNCDRTSLFVLDKNTNMLIVHSGDKLKKSEIQIPKDKGLVGACFESGQKIKVEDAYLDERFNKEIDKMTGYKTKSVLCMPLIDNEGFIFGVIQSVNKRGGVFDSDDEELMEIFSAQASVILKSSMNFDLHSIYTYRLKTIIQYSLDLNTVDTISKFSFLSECFIMTVFNNTTCRFIFYDSIIDRLYNVNKFNYVKEIPKVGIIHYVLKNKQFYGCNSMDDFYYNNLADIETGYSIVTFPMLDMNDNNNLIAIVQFAYNGTLNGDRKQMNEFDMSILEFFEQISLSWILKRDKNFYII